jgi:hypothetical protein
MIPNNYEINSNEPNIVISTYLENVFDKISSNENISIEEFKKSVQLKVNEIKNKIKECDNDMNLLKNEYMQMNIGKYLEIESKIKLIFDNKNVLNMKKNDKYAIILGEFFARYLFNSVKYKNNNNVDRDYSKEEFYSSENINSYFDETTMKVNDFPDINNNFKYWNILILLIYQLFNSKSNYNALFNFNELKNHIGVLLKPTPKENKKDKKKGKKDKLNVFMKYSDFLLGPNN